MAARFLALFAFAAAALGPGTCRGCRYNVRDLGFVDLEAQTYRVCVQARCFPGAEAKSRVAAAAAEAFRDANVALEWIEEDSPPGLPGLRLPAQSGGLGLITGVLLGPDGAGLPISLGPAEVGALEAIGERLKGIVASPVREALVKQAADGFAALLLVEGTEEAATDRALRAAQEAIEQARGGMLLLPKVIQVPPRIVMLGRADFAGENVLLWSLGLTNAGPAAQPALAIIYGQARQIGPLLTGDDINVARIQRVLAMIGADCECGLELSWTRGRSLPVCWNDALRTRVARGLGFDPESPRVKQEVAQILAKRVTFTAPLPGYQEIALDGSRGGSSEDAAAGIYEAPTPGVASAVAPGFRESPGFGLWGLTTVLAGLGATVLGIGVWLFFRSEHHDL